MDRYLCLFLFLFLTLFVEMRGGRDECMTSNGCGDQGPLIQFPFRLKHQPHHCGYLGFELSCTENNQTMLELPVSVKLLVKKIVYKSREIIVQDPDNCLARQLRNLNLAASPSTSNLNGTSPSSLIFLLFIPPDMSKIRIYPLAAGFTTLHGRNQYVEAAQKEEKYAD
ncbi:hypothetical protein AAG906_022962 [Vitis piasezkii]